MPLMNSKSFAVASRDFFQLDSYSPNSSPEIRTPFLWMARNLSMQRTIKTVLPFHFRAWIGT